MSSEVAKDVEAGPPREHVPQPPPPPPPALVLGLWPSLAIAGLLCVLSTSQVLLIRYTRKTVVYTAASVVLSFELIKLLFSVALCLYSSRKFLFVSAFTDGSVRHGRWYALPAFFYALCNNSMYVTLMLFDAYTVQAYLSTRLIFTGVLFQYLFQKYLSPRQWFTLSLLTLAVFLQSYDRIGSPSLKQLLLPLQAVLTASAAVMNEFLLKKDIKMDLNEQNFWMYAWGELFNLVGGLMVNGGDVRKLMPEEWNVWLVLTIVNGAATGIVTSVVFKYLNVFARNFANSMSVALTAFAAYVVFGTALVPLDAVNVSFISAAIMIYYSTLSMAELLEKARQYWYAVAAILLAVVYLVYLTIQGKSTATAGL